MLEVELKGCLRGPINAVLLNAIQQMSVKSPRQVVAADLWQESVAVKSARDRGLQSNDFGRILRATASRSAKSASSSALAVFR